VLVLSFFLFSFDTEICYREPCYYAPLPHMLSDFCWRISIMLLACETCCADASGPYLVRRAWIVPSNAEMTTGITLTRYCFNAGSCLSAYIHWPYETRKLDVR
jgi:hypothetical protein